MCSVPLSSRVTSQTWFTRVIILVEFDQGLIEKINLHVEIHAGRSVQANEAGVNHNVGILASGAWFFLRTSKSTEFLVTKVQSPPRMTGFSSQSLRPVSPSQTTWLLSP